VDLPLSTLADDVGACAAVLAPLAELIGAHVFATARIHGDDTPVPLLAKGKTVQARLWAYVRDDRPPPTAVYFFSRDRSGERPQRRLANYGGILQADAYAGFNALYKDDRVLGPITEAACWAHARRKFFVLADIVTQVRSKKPVIVSPIALEAVRRFDVIFEWERSINGLPPAQRLAVRAPIVEAFEVWMRAERAKLSRHAEVAKAMDYMLKRWPTFTRFLADGRICLSNNAAERALRGIALGRQAWFFAGSERGGERAAIMYTLIQTAMLNGSIPTLGLPMCSTGSPITPSPTLPRCSLGVGKSPAKSCYIPPLPPDPRRSPDGYQVSAARHFRLDTDSRNCTTSSGLNMTGSLRGSRAYGMRSGMTASSRRKRSAAHRRSGSAPAMKCRDEMHLESANVLQLQFVRGLSEIAAELRNRADVGSLRRRRKIAERSCPRSCGGAEGSSGPFGNLLSGRGLKHPILSDRRPITRPRRSRRDSGFVQSAAGVSLSETWYYLSPNAVRHQSSRLRRRRESDEAARAGDDGLSRSGRR
jgi:hypothetical protein